MARMTFGGTAADFVAAVGPAGVLKALPATLTLWSAKTGGTRYTDLMVNGSPATQLTVGTDGQVPAFQGPDGVTTVWADAGAGRVRIGAEITSSALADMVAAGIDALGIGAALAPAERTDPWSTTNTSATSTAGDVPGLARTIVGNGRPVELRAFLPNVFHSVANTKVNAGITVNGDVLSSLGSQVAGKYSPSTSEGPHLDLSRYTGNLTNGVTYTFGVRLWGNAAGTTNLTAAAFAPAQLVAIRR